MVKERDIGRSIKKSQYLLIGNLYTQDGVNYLFKNILANPIVNHLIVCGKDLNQSGKALINFFRRESIKIKG